MIKTGRKKPRRGITHLGGLCCPCLAHARIEQGVRVEEAFNRLLALAWWDVLGLVQLFGVRLWGAVSDGAG